MSAAAPTRSSTRSGTVQSVDRAVELLELLTDAGGQATLSELAEHTDLPLPTIHRLMRTLLAHGYVRQLPSRRYTLGPRLIRLGESAGRQLGSDARPYLAALAQELGESANLAMIDRDMVVYVAQASSAHSMRMFTEVGRRVFPHSAGVGKAVLSQLPDQTVMEILGRVGMPAATDRTIVTPAALLSELALIRERGFAVDDGEQEIGVRCFAVPVPRAPTPTALSISGPDSRVTPDFGKRAVPVLQHAAHEIAETLLTD
ncbi:MULTISPECIES: IclR family transcriptional regulator [unclassified Pseudactinotalea]|uniref:IclR family transcriptional regulator n=1 Tax=unclassified Pseudactinotalea TaxID=2649176 RepID=UPI00128CEF25|nr:MULTISPECIES: IclR family transcriptional regulator [unclassified Pseudactinotalea]MPV50339.1 helix-turn-helix domain-containing protein [Pseudactinotalea sp. HY160]QGH68936.1 helix-turn-helix domain-containing protein [Pseudactinotalea sp. HY158]